MMTKAKTLTQYVMMAVAVIMLLGAPTTAYAGPFDSLKDAVQDKIEEKKEELREKADEETEERLGVSLGFMAHTLDFYKELKFLKVLNYTAEGRATLGLLLIALVLFRYRKVQGLKDEVIIVRFLTTLPIVLVLGSSYELVHSYTDYRDSTQGLYYLSWSLPLVALAFRLRSLRGLRIARQGGKAALLAYLSPRSTPETAPIQEAIEASLGGAVPETAPAPQVQTRNISETTEAAPEPPTEIRDQHCIHCGASQGPSSGNFCIACGMSQQAAVAPVPTAVVLQPVPVTSAPRQDPPRENRTRVDDLFL